jgi:hypothetical protein
MSGVLRADIDLLVNLRTPLDLTVTSVSRTGDNSMMRSSVRDFVARFYDVIKSRKKIWAGYVAHGCEEKFILGFGGEG